MRTGKKLSLSSLLSILGVMCFATILVAAVLITSTALDFDNTTVTVASISLTKGTTPTAAVVGNDVNYFFNASVAEALTGAIITVYVNDTSILPANLTAGSTIDFNGVNDNPLSFSQNGANSLKATYTAGAVAKGGPYQGMVQLNYALAGTYAVSVVMTGNA